MFKAISAATFAFALGSVPDASAGTYNGLEIPNYTVETRTGAFELRSYVPFLAAEVQVTGSQNQAANRAFRKLAGFIFGGNVSSQKIEMTAPVTQEPIAQRKGEKIAMTAPVTQEKVEDSWTVRFMMPGEYTAQTLPKPKDPSVQIVTIDPGQRLVLVFSGTTNPSTVAKRTDELRAHATAEGLTIIGPVQLARYNDPFTAPWNRRNEVSFSVE